MVKLGTHEKPRTEAIPSKEIYKKYRFDFGTKKKEAKKAVSDARLANQKTPH
jgi:hypothetical protein